MPKDALLIVDVQNDFCPGGALAVAGGDGVVEPLNRMIKYAMENGILIFASRDWHPAETNHFKPFGGPWPVHCVQGTPGAKFHPNLQLPEYKFVINKGVYADEDAYSAFHNSVDGNPNWSRLNVVLRSQDVRVEKLYIGGLATDYCVKATVLDAIRLGYKVVVLEDAIRGVAPDTTEQAIREMKEAGAIFTTTDAMLNFYVPPAE